MWPFEYRLLRAPAADRLFSEKGILARGLAHPIVFMGQATPRALDGAVDGVVKRSEDSSKEAEGKNGEKKDEKKDANGMQTFFAKASVCRNNSRIVYQETSPYRT